MNTHICVYIEVCMYIHIYSTHNVIVQSNVSGVPCVYLSHSDLIQWQRSATLRLLLGFQETPRIGFRDGSKSSLYGRMEWESLCRSVSLSQAMT